MSVFDDMDLIVADFFSETDKFIQKQKEKQENAKNTENSLDNKND